MAVRVRKWCCGRGAFRLTTTAGNSQVTLNWTAVPGAVGYIIYYDTSAGTGVVGPSVATSVNIGAVTGLTNGQTYFFNVVAVGPSGYSMFSQQVVAIPSA